ncbi:MAG: O-antigen ligase family protein, partial [Lacipirellulaceae bacterium]
MYGVSWLLLISIFAWRSRTVGMRRGFGEVMLLSLLVPTWAYFGASVGRVDWLPFKTEVDMRSGLGIACLIACLTRPRIFNPWRWMLADGVVLALAATHVLSDWQNSGFSLVVPVRAFGEWVMPYLIGRIVLRDIDDLRNLYPVALGVALALSGLGLVEMIARTNLPEMLYGQRPMEFMGREMSRWIFKRAYAVAKHPIFFSTMLLLLMPWAMYAASRVKRGGGPNWYRWTPWIVGAGVVSSVSRGPILALPVLFYVVALICRPRWRVVLSVSGVLIVLLSAWQFQTIIKGLEVWSGESEYRRKREIVVADEKVEFSGTRTRLYLPIVYARALREAGLLGYGTDAVTGFPPRVPVGQQYAETLTRLQFVDNQYVLMTLRFGYLGLVCFTLLVGTAVYDYTRVALDSRSGVAFTAGMAGAIVAVMLVMITVWMPRDFGYLLLWSCGAGAALRSSKLSQSSYEPLPYP